MYVNNPYINNTNTTNSTNTKGINFEIFFIRHSESCANLAKKYKKTYLQSTYLDPELTIKGHKMAQEHSSVLFNKILPSFGWDTEENPVFFASSKLLRAQQTLEELIGSKTNDPYYVFPHIGEEGSTFDNKSLPKENQNQQLSKSMKKIDLRDTELGYYPSNFTVFQKWLFTVFLPHIQHTHNTAINFTNTNSIRIKLVIVTHSRFIKSILINTGKLPIQKSDIKLSNLDGIFVNMSYSQDGSSIKAKVIPNHKFLAYRNLYEPDELYKMYLWSYIPSNDIVTMVDCVESGCRKIITDCDITKTNEYQYNRQIKNRQKHLNVLNVRNAKTRFNLQSNIAILENLKKYEDNKKIRKSLLGRLGFGRNKNTLKKYQNSKKYQSSANAANAIESWEGGYKKRKTRKQRTKRTIHLQ